MSDSEIYKWRKLVVESLNDIQHELPTNQLVVNDVHIWPIIKINLFFYAYYSKSVKNKGQQLSAKSTSTKSSNFFSRAIGFLKRSYEYFYLFILPKRHIKYLTSGSWAHRINEKGIWLNRYFVNLKGKRIHIEYGAFENDHIELPNKSFTLYDLFIFHNRFFSKKTDAVSVKMEDDLLFKQIIDLYNAKTGLRVAYATYNKYLSRIIEWSNFWFKLLKKIKPEEVRVLCYYDATMFGLCIAGNKLSIPVIDMQHGSYGYLHSAYNSFGTLPEGGYNSLPSAFSVWDLTSKTLLDSAKIVAKEKVFVEGNPWIEFNRKKIKQNESVPVKQDILYTLQKGIPVPDFIIDVINEGNYKWVLKPHPAMPEHEIEIIKEKLTNSINENKVEIDRKNSLLPLLSNTKIHISAFSGSIQEAYLVGVPSIIFAPIGYENYRLQIEDFPDYFKYASTKEEVINCLNSTLA